MTREDGSFPAWEPPALPRPVLNYSGAPSALQPGLTRPRGKGLTTTIGIVSLIVAFIGLAVNGWSVALWHDTYLASVPPPPPPTVPPLAPVTFAPYGGDYVAAHGLTRDLRQVALQSWDESHGEPLNGDRRIMLDRLLAEVGVDAFVSPLSADDVRARVTSCEKLARNDHGIAPQIMKTRAGTITLTNNTVAYSPKDSANPSVQITDAVVTDSAGNKRWSARAIAEKMDDLHADRTPAMNALQAEALIRAIEAIPVGTGTELPIGSWTVGWNYHGYFQLPINGREVFVLPQGWVIPAHTSRGALRDIDPTTGVDVVKTMPFRPKMAGDLKAMLAVAVECGISLLLAVFLLISGISMFSHPSAGARMHLNWVALKIPCAIFGAVASITFMNSARSAVVSSPAASGLEFGVFMHYAVQLIYPVALVIVLFGTLRFLTRRAGSVSRRAMILLLWCGACALGTHARAATADCQPAKTPKYSLSEITTEEMKLSLDEEFDERVAWERAKGEMRRPGVVKATLDLLDTKTLKRRTNAIRVLATGYRSGVLTKEDQKLLEDNAPLVRKWLFDPATKYDFGDPAGELLMAIGDTPETATYYADAFCSHVDNLAIIMRALKELPKTPEMQKPVVERLVRILHEEEKPYYAYIMVALENLGPSGDAAINELVTDPDVKISAAAQQTFNSGAAALPPWGLRQPFILGHKQPVPIPPTLVKAAKAGLNSDDAWVLHTAAESMARSGREARDDLIDAIAGKRDSAADTLMTALRQNLPGIPSRDNFMTAANCVAAIPLLHALNDDGAGGAADLAIEMLDSTDVRRQSLAERWITDRRFSAEIGPRTRRFIYRRNNARKYLAASSPATWTMPSLPSPGTSTATIAKKSNKLFEIVGAVAAAVAAFGIFMNHKFVR